MPLHYSISFTLFWASRGMRKACCVLFCLLTFFLPFLTNKQWQVVEATQSFFLKEKNNSTWNEETKTTTLIMEQVCDSIATFFYSKTQKKRVGTYESILSQLVIKGQFFGQFV